VANLEIFAHDANSRSYPAGEWIVKQGEAASEMFVVIEGEAEIRLGNKTLETVRPGEIFGEMALIDEQPRAAGVIAMTPLKVAAIDKDRFAYLLRNHPFFAIEVMKAMVGRLRKIDAELDSHV